MLCRKKDQHTFVGILILEDYPHHPTIYEPAYVYKSSCGCGWIEDEDVWGAWYDYWDDGTGKVNPDLIEDAQEDWQYYHKDKL